MRHPLLGVKIAGIIVPLLLAFYLFYEALRPDKASFGRTDFVYFTGGICCFVLTGIVFGYTLLSF